MLKARSWQETSACSKLQAPRIKDRVKIACSTGLRYFSLSWTSINSKLRGIPKYNPSKITKAKVRLNNNLQGIIIIKKNRVKNCKLIKRNKKWRSINKLKTKVRPELKKGLRRNKLNLINLAKVKPKSAKADNSTEIIKHSKLKPQIRYPISIITTIKVQW